MPSKGRASSSKASIPPRDHRANRLLAVLEPEDFGALEPLPRLNSKP